MSAGNQAVRVAVKEPVALQQELEQALESGELVVVCWEPGCTMHRLPHWDEDTWVDRQQVSGYRRYSHGICHWHFRAYFQEIDRYLERQGRDRAPVSALAGT